LAIVHDSLALAESKYLADDLAASAKKVHEENHEKLCKIKSHREK
jgi:hypothetical protein